MRGIDYPCYGRVAIVDDKYEEVRKILSVLAENGSPYFFYDYQDLHDLTIQRVDGIRLLFLDIRLEEGTSEEKNLLTILASTVERIIPPQNGPYAIILWTNEYSMKDKVIDYLNENLSDAETTKPSFIGAIDKKEFLDKSTDCIAAKMEEFYESQKMLAFIMIIENNIINIPSSVLKLISYSFVNNLDNSELEKLFLRFASTDKGNLDSAFNATKTVLRQISDLIRDRYTEISADKRITEQLAKLWSVDFSDKEKVKVLLSDNSIEQTAIINTILNVNVYSEEIDNVPGKVYEHTWDSINNKIKPDVLMKSTIREEDFCIKHGGITLKPDFMPIEVDITPNCDYAQMKNHMLRTLYGYIVYIENNEDFPAEQYKKKVVGKIPDYVYATPVLMINDKLCVLLINTKLMDIEEHDYSDGIKYMFRLNDEITNDIRKKAGEVISRLGINCIE